MATNQVRSGRRRGAVVLATAALLALAVSPTFAHTNVSSSVDARHALLAAEQVGAGRDEVDELDELEQHEQSDEIDQAEAGDQGDAGDEGDHAAPIIEGHQFAEKKADAGASHHQASKSDGQDDEQGDDNDEQDDDQADQNDDHAESGDSDEAGDGGDSGESGD